MQEKTRLEGGMLAPLSPMSRTSSKTTQNMEIKPRYLKSKLRKPQIYVIVSQFMYSMVLQLHKGRS